MESGLLQLQDRRRDARGKHRSVDKVVGQLGGYRLVRFVIRVFVCFDEFCSQLPDRIMAGEEDRAALLQRGDRVSGRLEHAPGILMLRKISGRCLGHDQVLVVNLARANAASSYLSHIGWSNRARWAVPWVAETARKS